MATMTKPKIPRLWYWALASTAAGTALLTQMRRPPAEQPITAPAIAPAPAASAEDQSAAYESVALRARQRPNDANLALEAGSLAGNSGQYRVALQWFERAARLDPTLLPAVTGQGQMWSELHRPGLAAQQYERALRLAPDEPQLLLQLAQAYTGVRDFDAALRYALQVQKQQPNDPQVYRALANISAETSQRDEALKYASRACELGSSDVENWATRGALLLRYGRYPEAEQALKKAITLNPAHVVAGTLYARTLIDGRKTAASDREAFAVLARVRLLEPQNPDILLYQAQVLTRQGQFALGASMLQEAREASPRDPIILLALGQTLIRLGRSEAGVRLVNESQQLGPRTVSFVDLENLARRNPDPALAERLASLYVRQELYDSAIRVLERGLKRVPNNPRLRTKLAEVRQEVNRRAAAPS